MESKIPENEYDYLLIKTIAELVNHFRAHVANSQSRYTISGIMFHYNLNTGVVREVSDMGSDRVKNVYSEDIYERYRLSITEAIRVYAKLVLFEELAKVVTDEGLKNKLDELRQYIYDEPGDLRVVVTTAYNKLCFSRRMSDLFTKDTPIDISSLVDRDAFNAISCLEDVHKVIESLRTK